MLSKSSNAAVVEHAQDHGGLFNVTTLDLLHLSFAVVDAMRDELRLGGA